MDNDKNIYVFTAMDKRFYRIPNTLDDNCVENNDKTTSFLDLFVKDGFSDDNNIYEIVKHKIAGLTCYIVPDTKTVREILGLLITEEAIRFKMENDELKKHLRAGFSLDFRNYRQYQADMSDSLSSRFYTGWELDIKMQESILMREHLIKKMHWTRFITY